MPLSHRPVNSCRKSSPPRSAPHEADSVASEKSLEDPRITRKVNPDPKISSPTLIMVGPGDKYSSRSTTTPTHVYSSDNIDTWREGSDTRLEDLMVTLTLFLPESSCRKLPGIKWGLPSPKKSSKISVKQDSAQSNRQHNTRYPYNYKQGGRYEVGPFVCPSVENPDRIGQELGDSESPTHLKPAECGSREAIQVKPDHPEWSLLPVVFSWYAAGGTWIDLFQQHKLSQCVSAVPGSIAWAVDVHSLPWEDLDPYALPSSQIPLCFVQPTQSTDSAIKSHSTQEFIKPKSPCLTPRASAIKKQGFSKAVAAPQRVSTWSVYGAKWAIFTKWYWSNQVDFRAPSVKSIATFLPCLLHDRRLQPSTIDGYKSAMVNREIFPLM